MSQHQLSSLDNELLQEPRAGGQTFLVDPQGILSLFMADGPEAELSSEHMTHSPQLVPAVN